MRHAAALLFLAAPLAAFPPAPPPRPDRTPHELKALQGEWRLVRWTADGEEIHPALSVSLVVRGDRFTVLHDGREQSASAAAVVSGEALKALDFTPLAPSEVNRPSYAVCEVVGDSLRIADSQAARPADFRGGPGVGVSVYRRRAR